MDFADDKVFLLLLKEATSSAAAVETVDALIGAFFFRLVLNECKSVF